MLKKFLPGYEKHFDFDRVVAGVDLAARRARRLDQEAERTGEKFRNPTTGVYRLTESIARVEPAERAPSTPGPRSETIGTSRKRRHSSSRSC